MAIEIETQTKSQVKNVYERQKINEVEKSDIKKLEKKIDLLLELMTYGKV